MSTARVDGAPPPTTTTTDADAVDRIRFESAVSVLDARVDDDWNEWSLRDDVVILALTCALAGSYICLLYTSPSPRDRSLSRMPSSA